MRVPPVVEKKEKDGKGETRDRRCVCVKPYSSPSLAIINGEGPLGCCCRLGAVLLNDVQFNFLALFIFKRTYHSFIDE